MKTKTVLAAQGDEMSLQYERERTEGVRCANMRCRFNERGYEHSCSLRGRQDENATYDCPDYIPLTATHPHDGDGESDLAAFKKEGP